MHDLRLLLLQRLDQLRTGAGQVVLLLGEVLNQLSLHVRLGGGAATIRQYLQAGLVDELHIAISPVVLGGGESLFGGIDLLKLGYKCTEHATSLSAMHLVLTK